MSSQGRPRLLIASLSFIQRDPRVLRQINELSSEWDTTVCGYGTLDRDHVAMVTLDHQARSRFGRLASAARIGLGLNESEYWRTNGPGQQLAAAIRGLPDFDLILANDMDALPAVLAERRHAAVLADTHEFSPEQFGRTTIRESILRRHYAWMSDAHLGGADAVTTVGEAIADAYRNRLGIRRPIVVPNAPHFVALEPSATSDTSIELIHHGTAARERGIETLIEVVESLGDPYRLNLMLVEGPDGLLGELRRLHQSNSRIRFLDPVPTESISHALNRFDVGVYSLPPTSFNRQFALPNKFFEFVQGRLAIAIGPSPEMAHLVHNHGLGVVAPDFTPESLASSIASMSGADIVAAKRASHAAAYALSWETAAGRLREAVTQALERSR